MTPARQWEIGIFGNTEIDGIGMAPKPADRQSVLLDFLPFFERTVQQNGVTIDDRPYYDTPRQHWIGATDPESGEKRKFIFRRDPRDISSVWFSDPDLEQYFKIPFAERELPAIFLETQRRIGYPVAARILERLERLLRQLKRTRMQSLLIVGESNNGKTTLIECFLETAGQPSVDENNDPVKPVLLVESPPSADEKGLYLSNLDRFHAPRTTYLAGRPRKPSGALERVRDQGDRERRGGDRPDSTTPTCTTSTRSRAKAASRGRPPCCTSRRRRSAGRSSCSRARSAARCSCGRGEGSRCRRPGGSCTNTPKAG